MVGATEHGTNYAITYLLCIEIDYRNAAENTEKFTRFAEMSEQNDFYKILGIREDAPAEEIKRIYRKLARDFHPDRNKDKPGAEARFKEISEAYSVLSDDKKRRDYDQARNPLFFASETGFGRGFEPAGEQRGRSDPFGNQPFTSARGGRFYRKPDGTYVRMDPEGVGRQPFTSSRTGPVGADAGEGFVDIFSQFFGATAEKEEKRRSSRLDRHRTVKISFRRMMVGGKITLKLGAEKLGIPVPRGVEDGYKIRIRGRGNQALDGRRGDLYVTVRVSGIDGIWREGLDLHTEAKVSLFEAMTGSEGSVKIPLGKKIKVKIPAGVQPGEVLRIKGKGIETDKGTGNLLVHVRLVTPRDLTSKQKAIIAEAARKAGLK